MSCPPKVEMSSSMQLFRWIMQPLEFLETCAHRYGDCFEARLGNFRRFVFFSHPQAIERIFTAGEQFDVGRGNGILQSSLGNNSVLLLDGDRHKRQRQLLMPPFHGERMRAYGELICQITEQVTSQWQVSQTFAVRPLIQEISLRVILQAVFGIDQGQRQDQIKQLIGKFLSLSATRFGFALALIPMLQRDLGSWSPGGRFNRLIQQIDELLYAEIRARQEHPLDRTDILSLLLAARDEEGQPMSDEELRDELMTLLLAGHETTATALSWALYWVHYLPEVKTKLLAELAGLEDLDVGAIARLPYLNAVCSETLRIYPVAITTSLRIAKVPIQVMGYEFQPEEILLPCIYLTHQREDLYPEPKRFKPERFLERQFSSYEFLPFGGSNRRCIGAAFALFEMKLALVTVLKRYDLALAEKRQVVPVRRGVTIAPQGGIKMSFVAQKPAQGRTLIPQ